jgi:hypothetical protein
MGSTPSATLGLKGGAAFRLSRCPTRKNPCSSPFRLDLDSFGPNPAGPGMRAAGGSVPNPGMVACRRFVSGRAVQATDCRFHR